MDWHATEIGAEAACAVVFGVPAVYCSAARNFRGVPVSAIYTAAVPRIRNGVVTEAPKIAIARDALAALGIEPAQGDRIEFRGEVWEVDFAQRAGNGARWDLFPRQVV